MSYELLVMSYELWVYCKDTNYQGDMLILFLFNLDISRHYSTILFHTLQPSTMRVTRHRIFVM